MQVFEIEWKFWLLRDVTSKDFKGVCFGVSDVMLFTDEFICYYELKRCYNTLRFLNFTLEYFKVSLELHFLA